MSTKQVIENVHLFDGTRFSKLTSLHISNGKIVENVSIDEATRIDGKGGFLIPGLIDAHIHLTEESQLEAFRAHGQTTVLDMACWPAEKVDSFRNRPGLPDIRSAGFPATSVGSTHSKMIDAPAHELVNTPEQADSWVERRVQEGSDYIKVICDDPGPSIEVVRALREAARRHGKMTIAHAARLEAFRMAIECEFDIITHLPLDAPLTAKDAARMKEKGIISTPTLVMNKAVARQQEMSYESALESFKLLRQAGVWILASTDANSGPGGMPQHGIALFEEMEIMASLGMTKLEIIESATILPAKHFNFNDRGKIENGMRADLVLLRDSPLQNISAEQVTRVWCHGSEWNSMNC